MKNVFISYSHDNEVHKQWAKQFAERLIKDGFKVTLDQWNIVFGDSLPQFMETAVRENDFVLIICTENYKKKSDNRIGGTGYEGDIMTGEVLTLNNKKKFIPILRQGEAVNSMPSWLIGRLYVDLKDGESFEINYKTLVLQLSDTLQIPPMIGEIGATFGEPMPTSNISGQWEDSAGFDTIFFKQVGNRVIGIYNYGFHDKIGVIKGFITEKKVFEFEWKWLNTDFEGMGRMRIEESIITGIWWYKNKPRLIEHVGYLYLSAEMPSWLSQQDFNNYQDFLNQSSAE